MAKTDPTGVHTRVIIVKRIFQTFLVSTGMGILSSGLAIAQPIEDEFLSFNRPESWAMKYFSSVGLMNSYGPRENLKFGDFVLQGELANIPHLNLRKRTVGFYGTKEENLNKAPLLFRPTVTMGLNETLSASLSWVPPVEVFTRLETSMLGLSLNATVLQGESYAVGVRLFGQHNKARGDFTCPKEIAGKGEDENPFGCTETSNDIFIADNYGVELNLAYDLKFLARTQVFATASYQEMDLEFQVRALRFDDFFDRRNLVTEGSTHAYSIGIRHHYKKDISIAASLFYTPLDVRRMPDAKLENDGLLNLRLSLEYKL